MNEQLLETWQIHSRINLYILEAITPEALFLKPDKGRTVGAMFAHLHNVRLLWLQSAAPHLLTGLSKIDKDNNPDKTTLQNHLAASAQAIETMLATGLEAGRIKGFKPHPPAFLGYLISHEAYHHGEIGMVLTQVGHPLERKVSFGIWEWGVR